LLVLGEEGFWRVQGKKEGNHINIRQQQKMNRPVIARTSESTTYPTRQIDAIIVPLSLLVVRPPFGVWMRLPFCILIVLGFVVTDGELHFVAAAQTLEAARQRIKALAELRPGEYVIYNEQTGERMSVIAAAKRRTLPLEARFGKNTHSVI